MVLCPTKFKNEQSERDFPIWSMTRGLKNERMDYSEIKPPSPYPANRRKPGVTLPVGGRLPYKVMLKEEITDVEKEPVKSLKEIAPKKDKGKIQTKKGKKGKKK